MKSQNIKIGHRRRLRLVVLSVVTVVLSLMLAIPVQARASTVTTSTKSPLSLTVFVPCAVGGAGERVALSGTLHDLFHVTFDGRGGFHLDVHDNPQAVSGVGLTTGDKYQGTGLPRPNTQGPPTGTSRFTFFT